MKAKAVKTVIIWLVLATLVTSSFVSTVNAQLMPTIEGYVYVNGIAIDGASVTTSNDVTIYTTNNGGYYSITATPNESGTITASYNGFTSPSQSYDTGTSSSIPVDFYITTIAEISGIITYNGNPVSGATVTVSGLEPDLSDSSGSYVIDGVTGGEDVTITAQYTDAFGTHSDQTTVTMPVNGSDYTGADINIIFSPSDISGTIYYQGNPAGAGTFSIAALDGSTPVGSVSYTSDGGYSVTGLPNDRLITIQATYTSSTGTVTGSTNSMTGSSGGSVTGVDIYLTQPAIPDSGTTDGSGGSFQFQTANANAASGDVVVNVLRTGSNTGISSVEVWVSGASTAVAGMDFNVRPFAPITLTFGPGETIKPVTVSILGNHPGTASKNIVLMLANPSSGASVSAPETYTLALGDRPAATPTSLPTSPPTAKPTQGVVTTSPAPSHQPPTGTATPAPKPTTNATKPNWSWVPLLALIPLTGIVLYYIAFVRDR